MILLAVLTLLGAVPEIAHAEIIRYDFDSGVVLLTRSNGLSTGQAEFEGVTFDRWRFDGKCLESGGALQFNQCRVSIGAPTGVREIGQGAVAVSTADSMTRLAFFATIDSVLIEAALPAEFHHFISEFREQPVGTGRIEAKAEIEGGRLYWDHFLLTWDGVMPFNPEQERTPFFPFLDEFMTAGSTALMTPFNRDKFTPIAGQRLFHVTIRFDRHFYDPQMIRSKFGGDTAIVGQGEFLMNYEETRPFMASVLQFIRLPMALHYKIENVPLRLLNSRLERRTR